MNKSFRSLALVLAVSVTLSACALFGGRSETRTGVSSSLVSYLYPANRPLPPADLKPVTLKLPVRIGLAFVPAQDVWNGSAVLPEALKQEAIERVRKAFSDRPYIQHIEIIPDTYMRHSNGGGDAFASLDQLSRLYGFDLIALVSYDQVSVQSDTRASLLYWTIAGAYVIEGDRLETSTFVDTAVIDVKSRRLLFRAPGIHNNTRHSTLAGVEHERRKAQQQSFMEAMQQMTANLDTELVRFRERVREDNSIRITSSAQPGSSSGGGSGGAGLPLLSVGLLLAAGLLCRQRRQGLRACAGPGPRERSQPDSPTTNENPSRRST